MAVRNTHADPVSVPDWRCGLPEMVDGRVALREFRHTDASALYRVVSTPEIVRYTWPPPGSVEAVEQFIEWAQMKRARGEYICFATVPRGSTEVAGLFELRSFHPGCFRVEIGFVLHPAYWGTGVFAAAAALVRDFAFSVLGAHRIEARASVENVRGNAALRKMGAQQEGRLRAAFISDGRYVDQYLWALVKPSGTDPTRMMTQAPHVHYATVNA